MADFELKDNYFEQNKTFGDFIPSIPQIEEEPAMSVNEANEKALYALGSQSIDSILGQGYNFVQDLEQYSSELQFPTKGINLKLEQHNDYLTDQYVKDTGDYIPELMANPNIKREDKKEWINRYIKMINEPTRNEVLDNTIEELQKSQYIKNVANFPTPTLEDSIDQLNNSTRLFSDLAEEEVLKEVDEDYNTFTEKILPFFRTTDLLSSQVYQNILEDSANPFGVTKNMEEGFGNLPGNLENTLYKGVDFLNNKLDKDGSINWNASLARIAYEPIAFADFLLSIPAFIAKGIVDEVIPSLKGLAFPDQWERIKKERLIEQLKPTDQVGFWRKLARGLDVIPIEQHLRSWIKSRTNITDEEKEEYLMRLDNTITDQGLKGLEWTIDSTAEVMDATGFSDSKSKAKSLILSALVITAAKGLGKKAAIRLEQTSFIRNWAARARKRRRDKETELAKRAIEDLNRPLKEINPNYNPDFKMKQKERRGEPSYEPTDAFYIDVSTLTNFKFTGNTVKPGSPIDVTVRANPQLGSVIAEAIVKESIEKNRGISTAAASIFVTTPTQLLNSYYFNPLEVGKNVNSSITLYHKIANMINPLKKVLDDQFIHPVIYTIPNRKEKMEAVEKVLTELAPRQYHQEISNIGFTPLILNEGTGLTANQINIKAQYGKNQNSLIYSVAEAIEGYKYVHEAASKQFENPQVLIEEHRSNAKNIKFKIEDFEKLPEDYLSNGNPITIRWDYQTIFDPLANAIYGPQSMLPETTYYGIPMGLLQRSRFAGSWLNRNALVPSWYLTADLYNRNQVQRATKPFNEALNKIVKFHPDKLFDIINKGHRENREISWNEIKQMFQGTNIYSDGLALETLYDNYKIFRALNDLAYNIANNGLRENMVANGIEYGLWRTADISRGEAYQYLEGIDLNFSLPKYILQVQQKVPLNVQATKDLFDETKVTEDLPKENPDFRVWDQEAADIITFDLGDIRPQKNTEGAVIGTEIFDTLGRRLVKYYQPKSIDIGDGVKVIANYGVVDLTKYKIDKLPNKVLKYNQGQVHIVHKDPYFITLRPKELLIDGVKRNTKALIKSKNNNEYFNDKELEKYTEIIQKAGSVKIAKQIIEKLKDEFPGYELGYQKAVESPSDLLQVTDNYGLSVSAAKDRSEYMMERDLESYNIMDPVQSLVQSYSNAVKVGLTGPVERQLQALWEDPTLGMPEFLIDGKVPISLEKFTSTFTATEGNRMAYDAAHQLLLYRELMRSKNTPSEEIISGVTQALIKDPVLGLMEVVDNAIMDLTRMSTKGAIRILSPATIKAIEISNKVTGKSVINVANTAVSTVYIALNALRQPFVQNTQLFTYLLANPHRAVQQVSQLIAIGLKLIISKLPEAAKNTPTGLAAKDISNYIVHLLGQIPVIRTEFQYLDRKFEGLLDSGVLETIDMNLMVEAMTSSMTGHKLKPTTLDSMVGMAASATKVPISVFQQSFNISEGMQRIFFYLRAQEVLLDRLPANERFAALASPTFIAQVTKAGFDLSGSQAETGKFGYQRGLPGVMLKFAAIMQKIQNNIAQGGKITFDKNGRILRESGSAVIWSPRERAKFGIAQAVMFGKWGIPIAGSIGLFYFIDGLNEDDFEGEAKQILTKLKDPEFQRLIEGGLANRIASYILNNGIVEDTDFYKEKLAEYKKLLDDGMIDQKTYDDFKENLKINIDFSASVSPTGSGNPYAPIVAIQQVLEAFGVKDPTFGPGGFRFPLAQFLDGGGRSIHLLNMHFLLEPYSNEDMIEAFPRVLSPVLSGFNNYLKTLFADYYGDIFSKSGQPVGLDIQNPALAIAMAFGFQPEATSDYFEVLKSLPNNTKEYKEAAKRVHAHYRLTLKDFETQGKNLSLETEIALPNIIITAEASKFKPYQNEAFAMISREFKKLENRRFKKSGIPSIVERIQANAGNEELPAKELNHMKADLLKLRAAASAATKIDIDKAVERIDVMLNLKKNPIYKKD